MAFHACSKQSLVAAQTSLLICIALVPVLSAPAGSCGGDNQPACPADPPSKPRPYCTKPGVHAIYSTYGEDLSTDEKKRALKGWCWKIDPECGTAPGKPCCPDAYKVTWDPDIPIVKCNNPAIKTTAGGPRGGMYCKTEDSLPPTKMYTGGDASLSYLAGTCVANAPDCGEIGKTCCYMQYGSSSTTGCKDKNGEWGGKCNSKADDPADWRCVSE